MRPLATLTVAVFSTVVSAQIEIGGLIGGQFELAHYDQRKASYPYGPLALPPDLEGWGPHVSAFFLSGQRSAAFKGAVIYAQQPLATDYSIDITGAGGTVTARYSGHYQEWHTWVRIPLLLSIKATDRSRLEIGPDVFFLLDSRWRDEGTHEQFIQNQWVSTAYFEEADGQDIFQQQGFGVTAGLTNRFPMGLIISASYWRSLGSYVKGSDSVKANHNSFQLAVGYSWQQRSEVGIPDRTL